MNALVWPIVALLTVVPISFMGGWAMGHRRTLRRLTHKLFPSTKPKEGTIMKLAKKMLRNFLRKLFWGIAGIFFGGVMSGAVQLLPVLAWGWCQ